MNSYETDVALARNGDTEAFSRLYAAVYQDLYHVARYSLRSTHDACDVVSDTVMDAFISIRSLRNAASFRSWIFKILSAKIKRKQREYTTVPIELEETALEPQQFAYGSVELRQALMQLPDADRLLLSLSVLGGYTSDEIAIICRIKPATVRSRLSRMKEKLRVMLTR